VSILAIDPGPEESAWMTYSDGPNSFGICKNRELCDLLADDYSTWVDHLAIEGIACYGMPVGKETFDTCIWIGRFMEAFGRDDICSLIYRPDVKLHLCKSARANDANIRQALIDKFGPGKAKAIGLKNSRGPLYGVSKHSWSALAVAVTYCETVAPSPAERAKE
jgi:hypothetical protein